jgi:hypothetical protein
MTTHGTALHVIEFWRAAERQRPGTPAAKPPGTPSAAGRLAEALAEQRRAAARSIETRRAARAAKVAALLSQRARDLADQEAARRKRQAAKARATAGHAQPSFPAGAPKARRKGQAT